MPVAKHRGWTVEECRLAEHRRRKVEANNLQTHAVEDPHEVSGARSDVEQAAAAVARAAVDSGVARAAYPSHYPQPPVELHAPIC